MSINTNELFPFEYISLPLDNGDTRKSPFIQNVEKVLETDLQSSDSFGCKIKGSHTHAGSKVHFKDFIEAELLFHNSYYNHGFAFLTVEKIEECLFYNKKFNNKVVLIGYENYSELYLQEVKNLLQKSGIQCDYCVYETIARTHDEERITIPIIRNLYTCKNDFANQCNQNIRICYGYQSEISNYVEYSINDTLFVFIVPINTTLSTMDKMISLFKSTTSVTNNINDSCLFLCLITIGSRYEENNYYWKQRDNTNILIPKEERFIEINGDVGILTFAFVKSYWMFTKAIDEKSKFCECCFPDKTNLTILDEKPIFDVTRGSVVPMLQLGKISHPEPINIEKGIRNKENLRKVWDISAHMAYRHFVRRNNHFQYYFDTIGYLNEKETQEKVIDYLQNMKVLLGKGDKGSAVIYNYIVAPRHETNAKWVDLVYNNIFINNTSNEYNSEYNGARVLYFDITMEYRSNIKAKYSDFYRIIQNIAKSGQTAEIRFHYVDETIASGNNFIRAADLIRSLIFDEQIQEKIKSKIKISVFYSIFLLYGRSSNDTKKYLLNIFNNIAIDDGSVNNLDRKFHEYVCINNSTMRNHEDACTLCKLANDYRKIQKYCATNLMADFCDIVIKNHSEQAIEKIEKTDGKFQCSHEKRLLFFISHLLNERLSHDNMYIFPNERNTAQIDTESETATRKILNILEDYYINAYSWLKREEFIYEDEIQYEDFENAFIKSISRPFFIFHLRKREAAFTFCLKKLNYQLNKKDENYDFRLIETLVKALADMNANYIIRQSTYEKLIKIAVLGDNIQRDENLKRKYFSSINYLHSIKKMMSLTQDTTKSLLLEYLLVEGKEDNFFQVDGKCDSLCINNFYNSADSEIIITVKGLLYLENNRIIKDALKDISKGKITGECNVPYFFDNFKNVCAINQCSSITGEKFQSFVGIYRGFYSETGEFDIGINEIDGKISTLISLFDNKLSVVSFVWDKGVSQNSNDINKLFEFFMLANNTEFKIRKAFYNDINFKKLHDTLNKENNDVNDVIFLEDGILLKYKKDKEDCDGKEDLDESLYLKISGFDINSIIHWYLVKILLTLRSDFAKLIKKSNMSVIISERSRKMRESALKINKASTHSNRGVYMNMLFYNNQTYNPLVEKNIFCHVEEKFPLEKYLQLISNEWLSSEYRKVVRDGLYNDKGEHGGLYADLDWQKNTDNISVIAAYQKENLISFFGLKNEELETQKYEMHFLNDNTKKFEKVDIEFKGLGNLDKFKYIASLSPIGNMQPLVLIITLMAENVIKHNLNTNHSLEVEFLNNGSLLFKNKCLPNLSYDKINDILNCYPWIYEKVSINKEDPHITLWTLKHVFMVLSKIIDREISLRITIENLENQNSFQIEIKNFLYK